MGDIRVSSIVNGMIVIWATTALINVVQQPSPWSFLNEMVGVTGLTVLVVGLLKFPKLTCFLVVAYSVTKAFQV